VKSEKLENRKKAIKDYDKANWDNGVMSLSFGFSLMDEAFNMGLERLLNIFFNHPAVVVYKKTNNKTDKCNILIKTSTNEIRLCKDTSKNAMEYAYRNDCKIFEIK